MSSYKAEVLADSSGVYVSNGPRFATAEEAEGYVRDLEFRWTAVRGWRVVEDDEAPNTTWPRS